MIVTVVLTLFLYFIFQAGLDKSPGSMLPDFSWLSTRNMSVFIRPEERTALKEPEPSPCHEAKNVRILVAVYSAPRNTLARATIRCSVRDNYSVADVSIVGELGARNSKNIPESR